MEDDFLGVDRLVGYDRGAPHFRAGSCRGRDGDQRGDRVGICPLPKIADVLEIPKRQRLASHEGDELAGIEG